MRIVVSSGLAICLLVSCGYGATQIRVDTTTPESRFASKKLTANGGAVHTTSVGARNQNINSGRVSDWLNISPGGLSTNFNSPVNNYGFQMMVIDPSTPSTIYVGTCYQGLWKSTDQGATWFKVNTGANGSKLDTGRLWTLAIDPVNPQILYTTAGYGAGGILKSTDGGKDWIDMIPAGSAIQSTVQSADIYSIAIDPFNHNHVLATFHSVFAGPYNGNAPVIESTDGGNTWTVHPLPNLSYGHFVFFLGSSSTWLLGTQDHGFWRTTDAGQTWTQVSTVNMSHGASSVYQARNGVWYAAAWNTLLRSTDGGASWSQVGPHPGDYIYSVIGDGTTLYTQSGNTGSNTTGPQPYYASAEDDGINWAPYSEQRICNFHRQCDGPMSMAYDSVNHILYSSNWDAGVWKLKVEPRHTYSPTSHVVLSGKGSGSRRSSIFHSPPRWKLTWSYGTTRSNRKAKFALTLYIADEKRVSARIVVPVNMSGRGSWIHHGSGIFYLRIKSNAAWRVSVQTN